MKLKTILSLALVLSFFLGCYKYFRPNTPLAPRNYYELYEENGKYYFIYDHNWLHPEGGVIYGFSPRDGVKEFIEFQGDLALIYDYEMRPFTDRGKSGYEIVSLWKYIDKNGKVVLVPKIYFKGKLDEILFGDRFSEGLAAVMYTEGWGYININGETVVEPKYKFASTFKNGFASVYDGNSEKWILINNKGEYVRDLDMPPNWESRVQDNPFRKSLEPRYYKNFLNSIDEFTCHDEISDKITRRSKYSSCYDDVFGVYVKSMKEVERNIISIDIDSEWIGTKDTLILKADTLKNPQTFQHIIIKRSVFLHSLKVNGSRRDNQTKINKKNLIHSDNIYVLKQKSNYILMLVWDFSYSDCSKNFMIIEFYKAYDKVFYLGEIKNHIISTVSFSDSRNEIVVQGYNSCEEKKEMVTFIYNLLE